MTYPTYTVEIAFADPFATPGSWTDITAWVREIGIRRGRTHELSRSQAGTAQIRLRNTDRRFDPSNASGPYWPNLVPMTQVRITMSHSAATTGLFRGFVRDWGQSWPPRPISGVGDAETTLDAVDGFGLLGLFPLGPTYPASVLADSPGGYWRFKEAAGAGTAHDETATHSDLTVSGAAGAMTLGVSPGPLASANTVASVGGGAAATPATISVAGAVPWWITGAGSSFTAECWLNLTSLTAGGILGVNTNDPTNELFAFRMGLLGSGALQFSWTSKSIANDPSPQVATSPAGVMTAGAWTHLVVVRADRLLTIYVNGVVVATTEAPLPPVDGQYTQSILVVGASKASTQAISGKIAHVALYPVALSPNRIAAHYRARTEEIAGGDAGTMISTILDAVGWPSAQRSIDTGTSTMAGITSPSGSALDAILGLGEDSEQGLVQVDGDGKLTFRSRTSLTSGMATPAATFGEAEVPYESLEISNDDADLYSEVDTSGVSGQVQVALDTAAQTRYGPRVLSKTGTGLAADADARGLAGYLLGRYREPRARPKRMRLHVSGGREDVTEQVRLRSPLGDRVQVVRRPPGGGTITLAAQVEGMTVQIVPGGEWTCTHDLVPAASTQTWILEDDVSGLLDTGAVVGW